MSPSNASQLGTLLRRHREAAGYSYSEVGRRVGVPPSTVQRYERGAIAQPDPYKLLRFAEELGIEVEDLYAAAGLTPTSELPAFGTYLRARYGALPETDIAKVEKYFARLQKHAEKDDR